MWFRLKRLSHTILKYVFYNKINAILTVADVYIIFVLQFIIYLTNKASKLLQNVEFSQISLSS
jgi:hypothetical protein